MLKKAKRLLRKLSENSVFFAFLFVVAYRVLAFFSLMKSDEAFAKSFFRKNTGKELHLDNPLTFDEKVWWLKLYDNNPLNTVCTDKVTVRDYVAEAGYKDILIPNCGVFENARDINWDELPDECFVKCNHASGANFLLKKGQFDKKRIGIILNRDLKLNYYPKSRERNYKDIKPRIIAEKVLRDKNGELPLDYKFMCFNGEAKLLFLDIGAADSTTGGHAEEYYRNIYDMDFRLLPVRETRENLISDKIKKPENFERMIEIANKLSAPFPHCRVDLYNVDGKIYFGEITFHHGGGCNDIQPEEWDIKIGSWINIDGGASKPHSHGNPKQIKNPA